MQMTSDYDIIIKFNPPTLEYVLMVLAVVALLVMARAAIKATLK